MEESLTNPPMKDKLEPALSLLWHVFEPWLKGLEDVLKDAEKQYEEAMIHAKAGDPHKFGDCMGVIWKRVTEAREQIQWAITHKFNPPSNN